MFDSSPKRDSQQEVKKFEYTIHQLIEKYSRQLYLLQVAKLREQKILIAQEEKRRE